MHKKDLIKKFSKSDKDVGSIEVQLALLTSRINKISGHIKNFPKDKHSHLGLLKLVGRKKRFSRYLQREDKESFDKVNEQLKSL